MWTFLLPRSIRRLLWDFVWNACQKHWNDLCNLKHGLFTFFFYLSILTIVFVFSNAYRILYVIVGSLWCTVIVHFSSLCSTVVAHCIGKPLFILSCHYCYSTASIFVKLCNGWSCACRIASCLNNVISLWSSLKQCQCSSLFLLI